MRGWDGAAGGVAVGSAAAPPPPAAPSAERAALLRADAAEAFAAAAARQARYFQEARQQAARRGGGFRGGRLGGQPLSLLLTRTFTMLFCAGASSLLLYSVLRRLGAVAAPGTLLSPRLVSSGTGFAPASASASAAGADDAATTGRALKLQQQQQRRGSCVGVFGGGGADCGAGVGGAEGGGGISPAADAAVGGVHDALGHLPPGSRASSAVPPSLRRSHSQLHPHAMDAPPVAP